MNILRFLIHDYLAAFCPHSACDTAKLESHCTPRHHARPSWVRRQGKYAGSYAWKDSIAIPHYTIPHYTLHSHMHSCTSPGVLPRRKSLKPQLASTAGRDAPRFIHESTSYVTTTHINHTIHACAATAARAAAKTLRAYALTRATNHGLLLNTAHIPPVVPTPALQVTIVH